MIFLFSSRLGVFKKILGEGETNHSVIMQHCLYNYPVSSQTFIKNVFLQPSGSVLVFNNKNLTINKYWSIDEELANSQGRLNFNNSIDLLDEVLNRTIKRYCSGNNQIGLSLTGGWDGRLLLSYALKYLSPDQLLLYSHGILESPDVNLPMVTSKKLGLNYVPILLDDPEYLNDQLQWAENTVKYSDGIRRVSRLHYLYNMAILNKRYGINKIISGNGGSNLLKSSNYQPGDGL